MTQRIGRAGSGGYGGGTPAPAPGRCCLTTRALLDTNISDPSRGPEVVRDDIGTLFRWLEELKYEKLVHPDSVERLESTRPRGRANDRPKLESYKR